MARALSTRRWHTHAATSANTHRLAVDHLKERAAKRPHVVGKQHRPLADLFVRVRLRVCVCVCVCVCAVCSRRCSGDSAAARRHLQRATARRRVGVCLNAAAAAGATATAADDGGAVVDDDVLLAGWPPAPVAPRAAARAAQNC